MFKKISLIFSLLLIFSLVFCFGVFAKEYSFEEIPSYVVEGITSDISSDYPINEYNYFIHKTIDNKANTYVVTIVPKDVNVYRINDDKYYVPAKSRFKHYTCNGSSVSFVNNFSTSFDYFTLGISSVDGNVIIPLYSTTNIFTDSSCSEVFFRPLTSLAQIMAEANSEKTIQQTIIGLIPLLIGLLVTLLGFWKAWRYLSKILRQA